MGMPAFEIESEVTVEGRVIRLETDIGHMKADIAEIKGDIREIRHDITALRGEMYQGSTQLRGEMNHGLTQLRGEMNQGFTLLHGEMAAQRIELKDAVASISASLNSARLWALGLYAALAATLFGIMAHGFGWL